MKPLKIIVLSIVILILLASCETQEHYEKVVGKPKYRVTLYNNFGSVIETKYAHEYYESWDFGSHKNFEFRYWGFRKTSKKYGDRYLSSWEWNKGNVKIERINQ